MVRPIKERRAKADMHEVKRMAACSAGFGRKFELYASSIKTPDGAFNLTPAVRASVEDTTRRKFAVARTLAIGVLGGFTKKTGKLYLTIEGEDFYSLGEFSPGMSANAARRFAAAVNMQAKKLQAKETRVAAVMSPRVEPLPEAAPLDPRGSLRVGPGPRSTHRSFSPTVEPLPEPAPRNLPPSGQKPPRS